MFVKYEIKKTIHLLLFVLRSLGGMAETERIYALFYLADLAFLGQHGRLTFGSFYLAMRWGPAPYNILWLLLELRNKHDDGIAPLVKDYLLLEDTVLTALVKYDINYLSHEEVDCLFATIRKYKDLSIAELTQQVRGAAWQQADQHSVISVLQMGLEINASEQVMVVLSQRYEGDRWPKL